MPGQTGRKRTKAERENDLQDITKMYVRGMSLRAMSKDLSNRRKYNLSYKTIQKDVKIILEDWRKYSIQKIEDQKILEIKKINKIEVEAWKAFEIMSSFRSEGDARSAKFLEIVLKCIEKRCRIFGIDQPVETVLQRQIVVVNLPAIDGAENENEFQDFETLENE